MGDYIKNFWLSISLHKKIGIFAAAVILVMGMATVSTICIVNFSLGSFNKIMDDNTKCYDVQAAIDGEILAFKQYMRDKTEENEEEYVKACVRTERCLSSLPFDFRRIGQERYARTWNVKNGYEGYRQLRDAVAQKQYGDAGFVEDLSRIYETQEYLREYAGRLMQVTMEEGNQDYRQKVPVLYNIPYLVLAVFGIMMVVVLSLTKILSNTFVKPLVMMAQSARRIAQNDFSGQKLQVNNKDEMGELVLAFNRMKQSTEGYINTLKANNEMAERLHQEELEKVEMEKQLDAARLELLKNQINPHFLFNTLNMISCMAKLEDAETTEKMITSMSNLFRYNLKMSEQIVPLVQELKIVQDYMYIQQMRFGSRIRYESKIEADQDKVLIPAFLLQPLVENAIVHGIAQKEEGGRICLRIWETEGNVMISVADSGLGMSEEKREQLLNALKERRTARVGIGLGNIYKRIHMLYEKGDVRIYSRENCGTVIQIVIPQTTAES